MKRQRTSKRSGGRRTSLAEAFFWGDDDDDGEQSKKAQKAKDHQEEEEKEETTGAKKKTAKKKQATRANRKRKRDESEDEQSEDERKESDEEEPSTPKGKKKKKKGGAASPSPRTKMLLSSARHKVIQAEVIVPMPGEDEEDEDGDEEVRAAKPQKKKARKTVEDEEPPSKKKGGKKAKAKKAKKAKAVEQEEEEEEEKKEVSKQEEKEKEEGGKLSTLEQDNEDKTKLLEEYEQELKQARDEKENMESTITNLRNGIGQLQERLSTLQFALDSRTNDVAMVDWLRRETSDHLFDSTEPVLVYARVRPLVGREVLPGELVVPNSTTAVLKTRSFVMHGVWKDVSQEQVLRTLGHHVNGVVDGQSSAILVGGALGVGKTYTLFGRDMGTAARSFADTDKCELGLVPRALKRLLDVVHFRALPGWSHSLELSALVLQDSASNAGYSTALLDVLAEPPKLVSVRRSDEAGGVYVAELATRVALRDDQAAFDAFQRLAREKVKCGTGAYATLVRVSYAATDGVGQVSSFLDFVELPDTTPESLMLPPLLRELGAVARRRPYEPSEQDSALQKLLRATLTSRSKAVYVAAVSPAAQDEDATRAALETAVDLSLQADLDRLVPGGCMRPVTHSAVLATVARRAAAAEAEEAAEPEAPRTPPGTTPLRSQPSTVSAAAKQGEQLAQFAQRLGAVAASGRHTGTTAAPPAKPLPQLPQHKKYPVLTGSQRGAAAAAASASGRATKPAAPEQKLPRWR